jgi:hypothetical protein
VVCPRTHTPTAPRRRLSVDHGGGEPPVLESTQMIGQRRDQVHMCRIEAASTTMGYRSRSTLTNSGMENQMGE